MATLLLDRWFHVLTSHSVYFLRMPSLISADGHRSTLYGEPGISRISGICVAAISLHWIFDGEFPVAANDCTASTYLGRDPPKVRSLESDVTGCANQY